MASELQISTAVIKELSSIVGPANLFTGPEELVAYSYDATRTAACPRPSPVR